ncbi:UdgX family uracil-DNA binding protein [Mesorhizobium sp. RMAD-H1]|uniref:UdgX family uracil-DNA binding protein n=1 Tax=Mesorhizobium sp. RMAD-H1 TaxID=2587065 RepID=UPI00161DBE4C|nr:UdgX family uracil-DNA binding protein [Mesorhizobium sp. RMAD-H1]MBB2974345.1 DNA polymerase [Mesorhizobium sp. RMAD-H1]
MSRRSSFLCRCEMLSIPLKDDCSEEAFRAAARHCLAKGLAPDQVVFSAGDSLSLFGEEAPNVSPAPGVAVPRSYAKMVTVIVCHSEPDRFALLYRLLWRICQGERHVLDNPADPDVAKAMRYAKAVEKDVYRMQAYVRFAERKIDGAQVFVAWHEPRHRVLRLVAPFFVDRFSNMDWLIATPLGTAAWRGGVLTFGPPAARPAKTADAVLDELWMTYFRSTFNPARLRVNAMVAQMPKRHWSTMPETAQISEMVREAGARVAEIGARVVERPPRFAERVAERMADNQRRVSQPFSLDALRDEIQACRLCPLHEPATQAVPGEGMPGAEIMFVGEQPGDQEDLTGKPFVGPAGVMFQRALAEAGIERQKTFVTNAVKHFKFEPRGKRRVHMTPSTGEVTKCRFWLNREIAIIKPKLIVALGATAMLGITGRKVPVTKIRGSVVAADDLSILVTVHPSYLLRLPDKELASAEYTRFVDDLRQARVWCDAQVR